MTQLLTGWSQVIKDSYISNATTKLASPKENDVPLGMTEILCFTIYYDDAPFKEIRIRRPRFYGMILFSEIKTRRSILGSDLQAIKLSCFLEYCWRSHHPEVLIFLCQLQEDASQHWILNLGRSAAPPGSLFRNLGNIWISYTCVSPSVPCQPGQ